MAGECSPNLQLQRSSRTVWIQRRLALTPQRRGFQLITRDIIEAVARAVAVRRGHAPRFSPAHLRFAIDQRKPPTRTCQSTWSLRSIRWFPSRFPYTHTLEGPDDMPAHVKSALLGASLTISGGRWAFAVGHLARGVLVRASRPSRSAARRFDPLGRIAVETL